MPRKTISSTFLSDESCQRRLARLFFWLVWVCIVFFFSLPSIFYAFAQSLPAHNTLPLKDELLRGVHRVAPLLTVMIDVILAAPLSTKYAKLSGLKADRLLMAFRLFSAWLLAFLTTIILDENCLSNWKVTWTVCQKASAEHRLFTWDVYGEEILNTEKDICQSSATWWSDGRCSRAIVGNLATLLEAKRPVVCVLNIVSSINKVLFNLWGNLGT